MIDSLPSTAIWATGWTGLISNFVAGVLLGAIYVLRSRTLPSNVIAHALADSLGLVAIYLNLVA